MQVFLKLTLHIFLTITTLTSFSQITMLVRKDGFLFKEGKDSIFFYQRSPKDLNGQYSRCNYIHPLYDLGGFPLTEDFPVDHLHHRGIFWAWHQIYIGDRQVSDGWELKNFVQQVTGFEFLLQKGAGIVNTEVEWKSPLWKNGAEAYLKENTQIKIFPLTDNYRRIDFEIKLKALTDRLRIGGSDNEKGYGGFSVRLQMPKDVEFVGEDGAVEPGDTAVAAGTFVNISGNFRNSDQKGGVVIWSNPSNPGPANLWILRKAASMQNAAYPGRQLISVPYGKPLVLRYSLIIYRDKISSKQIRRLMR
jgi:hypothetical protein